MIATATLVPKSDDELTPEDLRAEIRASLLDARVTAAWLVLDPRRGTGYFTPVARRRADESIRRERRSQIRVDATKAGLNASPEANVAGLNTGPTPAPGNLQVLSADTQLLFAVRTNLRLVIVHLERAAGICVVKPVPENLVDLAEHLEQLLDYLDDRRVLARLATQLAAAVAAAGELAYGESMTELREPCIHCRRRTLVMFWARRHNEYDVDFARCDRDPRTGHYAPCTCADPICECKRRPVTFRHEWARVPGNGPHTIDFLKRRLAQIRTLNPEGSPA